VVSKTHEDKSGAIASYRTGLVLEAQRISKLKRRNGPEGTQRSTAATRTQTRRGGDTPSQPSNPIRDFLTPHIGIRALGGDNQCLPVCRCGTGKASAVRASLKLSIGSGEIFAVFRRRAEV